MVEEYMGDWIEIVKDYRGYVIFFNDRSVAIAYTLKDAKGYVSKKYPWVDKEYIEIMK